MKRRISILGATGSVGTSTLDLIERHPDRFEVVALTAASNAAALAECARRTGASLAVIADEAKLPELREALAGTDCRAATGRDAMLEAAAGEAEWVMAAIVGCAGLEPVMAAVEAGRTIALANKEALVTAGSLMTDAAKRSGATILPVDSEHNAIFQCLAGNNHDGIARLILTASGGPFRTWAKSDMDVAGPEQALKHPNWSMGAKISIDSATMMNKGLELIEAHHLFGLPSDRIDILVHPQSVIHSMVEYVDGSTIAQLGSPDMRIPIAHCLAHPDRIETRAEPLDLIKIANLTFEAPDSARFPSLRLARAALESGKGEAIVLNAANELAVAAFLDNRISFGQIAATVERAIDRSDAPAPSSIADVIALDQSVRRSVGETLETARLMLSQPPVWFMALAFFAAIGPLIIVHELGHYWVARWFGVGAEAFSIGFGKEITGWTDKRGTRWRIGLLPLGGYVKFVGDVDPTSAPVADDEVPANLRGQSFHHRPPWQRFLIVLAGPMTNFLVAILIFVAFFAAFGKPLTPPVVQQVVQSSAAEVAGLRVGDRIVEIAGRSTPSFEELQSVVTLRPGEAVDIAIVRDGREMSLSATLGTIDQANRFGQRFKIGQLGVGGGRYVLVDLPASRLLPEAVSTTYRTTVSMIDGLWQIISGRRSIKDLGGPLRMAQIAGQVATLGVYDFIRLIAFFSINLGFINLLPIPMLDGGHLVLYAIETVRRRPASERIVEWAFRGGLAFLATLLLVATFNDLGFFGLWEGVGRLIG